MNDRAKLDGAYFRSHPKALALLASIILDKPGLEVTWAGTVDDDSPSNPLDGPAKAMLRDECHIELDALATVAGADIGVLGLKFRHTPYHLDVAHASVLWGAVNGFATSANPPGPGVRTGYIVVTDGDGDQASSRTVVMQNQKTGEEVPMGFDFMSANASAKAEANVPAPFRFLMADLAQPDPAKRHFPELAE